MAFADGSIATLTYTALGSTDYPKEQLEVFVDGKVLTMHDYKNFSACGAKIKPIQHNIMEKGHMEELVVFADAIQNTGIWPIPLWQQIQVSEISFIVNEQLKKIIKIDSNIELSGINN